MNQTGISEFNQARIEWAIRLRYSPMPDFQMETIRRQLNEFRIGELRTVGKTWEIMMERDGELAINSEKRKADSATLDWQIASDGSPDGDKHAAALQYFYNNLTATKALDQDATGGVDELIFQVLSALDYYYSAHEILLRVDNPATHEVTAEFRHTPVWFFEARRGYLGYLKHIFDLYGQPCIAGEWLTAVNTGWMRPLSVAYFAKWTSFADWMIFCRRYGSGFLEGITEATKDSTEWNDAMETLRTLSNDAVVLHNKTLQFKFLEQPGKNQLPFQPMMEMVDRLYAKCYRGVDLATGSRGAGTSQRSGGGQNAVGASVQREESGILLVRDAKWVTGVFNDRIDRPIIRYLFNEEPRAWFALVPPLNDTTAEDLQSLSTLVPMGLRVALKEVYQRFRWSVPGPGEPCLSQPSSSSSFSSSSSEPQAPGNAGLSPAGPNAEGRMQNEEKMEDNSENPDARKSYIVNRKSGLTADEKTLAAQTTDTTPIAAGADSARNPGLLPTGARTSLRFNGALVDGASRQMPDTQVDASDFWSRVGLAPRGADGQTLPMPSLGYAVPNAVSHNLPDADTLKDRLKDLATRGLGHCRAAQSIQCEINRRIALNNHAPTFNQIALPNYDPDERRDRDGKWTTGGNTTASAANSPAQTPAEKPGEAVLRPLTWRERLVSDLRILEHKFLPGTRTGRLEPTRISEGVVGVSKLAGDLAKAIVGDVAAGMRADPEFSGNIPAFFKGEELPMDTALRDAAQEQNFRGEVPIATVMGRISEGLASTAPMIPLVGGLPAAAQQTALAAFTAKMVTDTPEIARQLGEEFGKPPDQRDPNKIDSLVAQAIQTVGFAAAGGVGLKRSLTVEPGKDPTESPETQKPPAEPEGESTYTQEELDTKYPRVWLSSEIRAEIWERSKAPDGKVYDPSGVEIKPGEPWDAGHRPEYKFSDAQQRAARQDMDTETWKAYQRDPDIYRPERPRTNLSHRYESDH